MTIQESTTRAALVATATALAFDGERVPFWDESEYVRGMCELIADACGVSDTENAKSEIWEAMNAEQARVDRNNQAHKIAAQVETRLYSDDENYTLTRAEMREALTAAALAAIERYRGKPNTTQEGETA